jgi:hypothetical protein
VVLLRKSIPQSRNLKVAAELNVKLELKMKEISKVIIALCFLSANVAFSTTFAVTYPSALNMNEKLMLEVVACHNPYGLKIKNFTAYAYKKSAKEKHAVVVCESNGEFEGSPAYNLAYCDNESRIWQCNDKFIQTTVPINNRSVELKFAVVSPKFAYEALQKLSKSNFQSKSINKLIGNSCTVYNGSSAEENEFNCGGGDMLVSYFCPTENCPRIIWVH